MSANKAFDQWVKQRHDVPMDHEKGCYYEMRAIPINECTCDCYDKAVFRAGYLAAKGRRDE